jgi:hypothetical protein
VRSPAEGGAALSIVHEPDDGIAGAPPQVMSVTWWKTHRQGKDRQIPLFGNNANTGVLQAE